MQRCYLSHMDNPWHNLRKQEMCTSVFHFLISDSKEEDNIKYDNPFQSNNHEYIVFSNASWLVDATTRSSDFVMLSSHVTMTCLQRESSRSLTSHLG